MLGSKCRLCRHAEKKLYLKGNKCFTTKCPVVARNTMPGGVSTRVSSRSDFSTQLTEKQNAARAYLMRERQLKLLYKRFIKNKRKNPNYALITPLELRLYNVLYRGGLAFSKANAKQLVTHGFILVNDKPVTVPGKELKVGDKISFNLAQETKKLSSFLQQLSSLKRSVISWIERDDNNILIIKELPGHENTAPLFNEQKITEYYSR